ncbi:MAG: hypothetical protein OEZ38_07025, partial [Gammaproteobacteria bacterium]|nr:hypothetical protein [Gammaproteobacteria bacterium]
MQTKIKLILLLVVYCFSTQQSQAWTPYGHIKYNLSHIDYPAHAVSAQPGDDQQSFNSIQLRLALDSQWQSLSTEIHYELTVLRSNNPYFPAGIDRDRFRALDLTDVVREEQNSYIDQRLDRLSVGYTADHLVFRLGRQAVSWGNGLVFHPMDILSPFDPVAIDKDYKPGDDMLYAQWLINSIRDIQLIALPRRNITGQLDSQNGSLGLKLHTMIAAGEMDLLLARHYDQSLLGLGYVHSVLDAIWRFDVVVIELNNNQHVTSFITNLDYSWLWLEHNIYGFVEYFHSGFGEEYSTSPLNAELINRLSRGELFTMTKDYLA